MVLVDGSSTMVSSGTLAVRTTVAPTLSKDIGWMDNLIAGSKIPLVGWVLGQQNVLNPTNICLLSGEYQNIYERLIRHEDNPSLVIYHTEFILCNQCTLAVKSILY